MNQSLTLIQQDLIKLIKEGSFDKEFIFKFLTIYEKRHYGFEIYYKGGFRKAC